MKLFLSALLLGLVGATRAADAPATKLFAITITTGPAWDAAKPANEQKFFREHSANLARLRAENMSVLGGRFSDKGFLIVRAASEPAVRAEIAKDPSIAAGIFQASVDEYRAFQHGDTRPPLASPEVAVVRAFVAAHNARDADGVAALLADDVRINEGISGVDSRESMRQWLAKSFQSERVARVEMLDITQTGPLVAYRERTSWTNQDGSRHVFSSIVVCKIQSGKVDLLTRYPAHRETVQAAR